jgi:superfamily II DNA or RNA helicase
MLTPVKGCLVRARGEDPIGEVLDTRVSNGRTECAVRWPSLPHPVWLDVRSLSSGFPLRAIVQAVPRSRLRRPLGTGEVLERRTIGGMCQHLVEFAEKGLRLWIPYENLRHVRGARQRFVFGQAGQRDQAERFRLRLLAHAIEAWHENTGALARLHIDPLPHQIHLVHHILKSGNLNWLIADDVGLGKTVEVGMLISALKQKGACRRVLLVTPAGLVRQWKEEMHHKFGLSDFRIYGEDFRINEPREWKLHDHVIGSLDTLKHQSHLESVTASGMWDLIVFDEAHRLSRTQSGMKFSSSERYQLARKLRTMTDSVILLSATPHQGMQDKFQALLEIIRPEMREAIRMLDFNPGILAEMVIRNNKADVTDSRGKFIFQGKVTKVISVPAEPDAIQFDKALQHYLKKGYAAGESVSGAAGRAIGFVMAVYRKLAASSVAAIRAALARRLQRLEQQILLPPDQGASECSDERYLGEWEERIEGSSREFFNGEVLMLKDVLDAADRLLENDGKIRKFIEELVQQVLSVNSTEKVLIFSEYRATQDYVSNALRHEFGTNSVSLIHGGMDHQERAASIEQFEASGQFLVSTEAGAEGINLQRHCHIVINFDLPWNPMRLVQRVGRLYRYGQTQPVLVFNMHAPHTLDASILQTLYARIDQVVADMTPIGGEFRDGLRDDIMGQMADLVEVDAILDQAIAAGPSRTEERIRDALDKARGAVSKQQELFCHASGFNPRTTHGELALDTGHIRSFVMGMCSQLGIEVRSQSRDGMVMTLHFPEDVARQLSVKSGQIRISFDRNLSASDSGVNIMDSQSPIFRKLLEQARLLSFGGLHARTQGMHGAAAFGFMLYWQNEQGSRLRQEFIVAIVDASGDVKLNGDKPAGWLMDAAQDAPGHTDGALAERLLNAANAAVDRRLMEVSNDNLQPEGRHLISCAWLYAKEGPDLATAH